MINVPVKVFPKQGFLNETFQILRGKKENSIKIFFENKLYDTINPEKDSLTYRIFEKPGNYRATCKTDNEEFSEEFTVLNKRRFGSSVFDKAFIFDDFTFIKMKDRLHIYNENLDELFLENNLFADRIIKIDKKNYLFIKQIDNLNNLIKLSIYNTDKMTIVSELKGNGCKEIFIQKDKAWISESFSDEHIIYCFSFENSCFNLLKKYKCSNYYHNNLNGRLILNHDDKITVVDLEKIFYSCEYNKFSNCVITKDGDEISMRNNSIRIINYLDKVNFSVDFPKNYFKDGNWEINYPIHRICFHQVYSSNIFYGANNEKYSYKRGFINSKNSGFNYKKHETKVQEWINLVDFGTDEYILKNDKADGLESYDERYNEIYRTVGGYFLINKVKTQLLKKITYEIDSKKGKIKDFKPDIISKSTTEIFFIDKKKKSVQSIYPEFEGGKIDLKIQNQLLIINEGDYCTLLIGNQKKVLSKEAELNFFSSNSNNYISATINDNFTLFDISKIKKPIFEISKNSILNFSHIEKNEAIWYKKINNTINRVYCYKLSDKKNTLFNEGKLDEKGDFPHKGFSGLYSEKDYKFNPDFILSKTEIIINPKNLEIKGAVVGNIISHNKSLNKVITSRGSKIYFWCFDDKFIEKELPIESELYDESYLHPNGRYILRKEKEKDKYSLLDIETDEIIDFFSGKFLEFDKDGKIIMEDNKVRDIIVYDPITLKKISSSKFHFFRFKSPDEKLYVELVCKYRYFKQDKEEGDWNEISRQYFINARKHPHEHPQYRKETYVLGGIVKDKSKKKEEIKLTDSTKDPYDDIWFVNYVSFSHDNKFLSIVGKKRSGKGFIFIFKVHYDEKKSEINFEKVDTQTHVTKSSITKPQQNIVIKSNKNYKNKAIWVCGINKDGILMSSDSDGVLWHASIPNNLKWGKSDSQYKKSFMCFSPSGEYMALTNSTYESLLAGGRGHVLGNEIYIAKIKKNNNEYGYQIVETFKEHGSNFSIHSTDRRGPKKITNVMFSKDEKKIMTISKDGVIIVRDLTF